MTDLLSSILWCPVALSLHLMSVDILVVFRVTSAPLLYALSLHDALPIFLQWFSLNLFDERRWPIHFPAAVRRLGSGRSEEHTSELQSRPHIVCRLLLEKKNTEGNTVRGLSGTRAVKPH